MERDYFAHESAVIDDNCKIGQGSKIWHFCHVMSNSTIGQNCNLGQNVLVSKGVILGKNVKVQNNVSIYTGVICEDDVFLGPSMVFTNVILEDRVFLWHRKDRKDSLPEWQTINDLKPYTIGIVSGYTYRDKMDQAIENDIIKTQKVNSAESNLKKLLGKRFDGFLESESVVISFFQKYPKYKDQITHAPKIVSKDVFRIGISKNSPFAQILPEINRIIHEMKKDGTIDRIMTLTK